MNLPEWIGGALSLETALSFDLSSCKDLANRKDSSSL